MDTASILNGKHILIVDDEPDVLESLTDLLDMCHIDAAPNFETAESFLSKRNYDAAVLDIMGVDGYKLLEIVNQKRIPALMLTAHALSPDNLIISIKKGARTYLPKEHMFEIESFLEELLQPTADTKNKKPDWFLRLKPEFDRKFGKGWREKDRPFWEEFDKTLVHSREELEKIL
jgi:DNA-binding response OmpR family regulator